MSEQDFNAIKGGLEEARLVVEACSIVLRGVQRRRIEGRKYGDNKEESRDTEAVGSA